MVPARCESCGTSLPVQEAGGRPARYCSAACRQRAFRERRRQPAATDQRVAEALGEAVGKLRGELEQLGVLASSTRSTLTRSARSKQPGVSRGQFTSAAVQLRAQVDQVLNAAAAADRAAGATWDDIGQAMGVDGVTANRRLAHALRGEASDPPAGDQSTTR